MHMLNSFMFGGFNIIFMLMFLFIMVTIIVRLARGAKQWNENNHSPRLTVDATITSKRQEVSVHHHQNAGAGMSQHTSTTYYATFEVESGDRMELCVGRDYGMLSEGDQGKLTFQGTRYLGFERQ